MAEFGADADPFMLHVYVALSRLGQPTATETCSGWTDSTARQSCKFVSFWCDFAQAPELTPELGPNPVAARGCSPTFEITFRQFSSHFLCANAIQRRFGTVAHWNGFQASEKLHGFPASGANSRIGTLPLLKPCRLRWLSIAATLIVRLQFIFQEVIELSSLKDKLCRKTNYLNLFSEQAGQSKSAR